MRILRGWNFGHILLLLGAIAMFFPMLWMLFSMFKTEQEMFDYPPRLLPREFTLEILQYMWAQRNFSRMFLNSSIVAVTVTALTVLSSAYVGFVWAKFRFRNRDLIFYLVIATMMIPLPVLLIPAGDKKVEPSGLANAEVRPYPGADHDVHAQQPEALARDLLSRA